MPRTLAVIAVYLAFFTALPFLGFLAAGPVSDQATSFANDVPGLVDNASALLDDVQEFFDDKGVNVQIKGEGDSALASLQDSIVTGTGEIVSLTGELLRLLVELSLLRDPRRRPVDLHAHLRAADRRPRALGHAARRRHAGGRLPDAGAEGGVRLRARPAAVQRDHGRLGGRRAVDLRRRSGSSPTASTYAFAFGLFFGIMELVPYVGPVLGALPPVIVALVQDPLTALWVVLLFVALQQLEGHVVAPNVFGRALRLNPLLVILALLLGGQIYGFVGALVALPIAAVLRETVVYLKRHLVFEPWGTASPLIVGPRAPATASRRRRPRTSRRGRRPPRRCRPRAE